MSIIMYKFLVYALVDPTNDSIFYIGRSSSGLRRPRGHFSPSSLKKPYPVYYKINSLLKLNIKPYIQVMEECESNEELDIAEMYYIREAKEEGYKLYNVTLGGKGMLGRVVSQEIKDRLSKMYSNRKMSKESIEKSKETKRLNTRKFTKEERIKYSLVSPNKKKVKCITDDVIFGGIRVAARAYGIDHKGIVRACKNKSKCANRYWEYVL